MLLLGATTDQPLEEGTHHPLRDRDSAASNPLEAVAQVRETDATARVPPRSELDDASEDLFVGALDQHEHRAPWKTVDNMRDGVEVVPVLQVVEHDDDVGRMPLRLGDRFVGMCGGGHDSNASRLFQRLADHVSQQCLGRCKQNRGQRLLGMSDLRTPEVDRRFDRTCFLHHATRPGGSTHPISLMFGLDDAVADRIRRGLHAGMDL